MTDAQLDADRIRTWLEQHPDFLAQHPELLDGLELPASDESVTSLIGYQNQRLIEQNRQLKHQLEHLSGIAGQNEKLMQRLHKLTLHLSSTSDLTDFIERLGDALRDDFDADTIGLLLRQAPNDVFDHALVHQLDDEQPDWVQSLIKQQTPYCGRLTQAKRKHLLADEADQITSAALVPLDDQGLLLIGARSAERFHPDMGTLFLDLLGETVRVQLGLLIGEQPSRRSA